MSIDERLNSAKTDDAFIGTLPKDKLTHPELNAEQYYKQVATDPYFRVLTYLRHHIKTVTDAYFSSEVDAKNIDLFLMTSSVSSPAGPGSDSEPIPLNFDGLHTYLVDSSQFGFEPILIGGTPRAYCYLASLRGETPDARHLNQFYHGEYEAQEDFETAMQVAEGYVRSLLELVGSMSETVKRLSADEKGSFSMIESSFAKDFDKITFDEAISLLEKHADPSCVRRSAHGDDITSRGEIELLKILKATAPIWIMHYPRDRVPFYQKPLADNPERVLNADLICPMVGNGFSGEFLGMGQRQDSVEEMYESMRRQGVDPKSYEWYVDLRRLPNYKVTSGFGLGIERFISWVLGLDSIHKAILYPRMKGVKMNP